MNQQHQAANQAAGQGLLERLFALQGHGTTARTEVIAGITTFLTMVYIVFVNPQILSAAGMDTQAVFVTTCLIAGIGSILMGLLAEKTKKHNYRKNLEEFCGVKRATGKRFSTSL